MKNGFIITVDGTFSCIKDGAVAICDGVIVDVGKSDELVPKHNGADFVIDAKQQPVLPGLINMHTHMFQAMLRGLGDDMALVRWIGDMLYRIAPRLDQHGVKAAADLSCVEMIRTGVTTVVDHHDMKTDERCVEAVASSIRDSGLRGFVCRGLQTKTKRSEAWKIPTSNYVYSEVEDVQITEKLVKSWKEKGNGRVTVCPGPSAIFECTPQLLHESHRISTENSVPFHIHIAETMDEVNSTIEDYGCREVELLSRLGVLDERTHIVHAVWLNDNEIELVGKARASVVHCPVSNMYLASGVAPITQMINRSVNVALGTDGPASNNSHDMFEVMKFAALLCKVTTRNPASISAKDIIQMATMGGAKSLKLDHQIGSIEEGKRGDIIVVDLRRPHSVPIHNPVSSIVYCSNHNSVQTVIADGHPVMLNGILNNIDELAIISEVERYAEQLEPKK